MATLKAYAWAWTTGTPLESYSEPPLAETPMVKLEGRELGDDVGLRVVGDREVGRNVGLVVPPTSGD